MSYDINLEGLTKLPAGRSRYRLHDLEFYFPFFFDPTSL